MFANNTEIDVYKACRSSFGKQCKFYKIRKIDVFSFNHCVTFAGLDKLKFWETLKRLPYFFETTYFIRVTQK